MLPHRTAATATALAGKCPAEALQKVEGGEADDEGNEKGFHCFAPWDGKAAWRHEGEDILNENRFQLKN